MATAVLALASVLSSNPVAALSASTRPEPQIVQQLVQPDTPTKTERLGASLEHSRIRGEYYRMLSADYAFFLEQEDLYKTTHGRHGQRWPEHPFPNEKFTLEDVL